MAPIQHSLFTFTTLLLLHLSQSIKFFISSPTWTPNEDVVRQSNSPFPVNIDYKNTQQDKDPDLPYVELPLRFDNQIFVVQLLNQNFIYQFKNTSTQIELTSSNKERVLDVCRTAKLQDDQCLYLLSASRATIVASMCSRVITHLCVADSCAPFFGVGPMTLYVTLQYTGVHWLEVKPRYSQPACAIDKMVHIINQLPLRTIVLDPHCPYVSKVVSPTYGSWPVYRNNNGDWQEVVTVTTNKMVGDWNKNKENGREKRTEQKAHEHESVVQVGGRVCITTNSNISVCGLNLPFIIPNNATSSMNMFVNIPSIVGIETWWEGPDGSCSNVTTVTIFQPYITNNFHITNANKIDRQEPELEPELEPEQERIVLTGLNDKYFDHLEQLVGSLKLWEPEITIEVVDLGLSTENIDIINTWGRLKVIPFDFQKYPSHVKDLGTYAFKILAIQEALERHPRILWIDAGRLARDLGRAWHEMGGTEGSFFVALLDDNHGLHPFPWGDSSFHHPKTMEKLEIEKVNLLQTQCDGAVQGWNKQGSFYEKAFPLLVKCALDIECIAPEGSNRQNHLQDQTVLNAVFSKLGVDPCKNNKLFDSEFNMFDLREIHANAMFRRSYPNSRDANEIYLPTFSLRKRVVVPLQCPCE